MASARSEILPRCGRRFLGGWGSGLVGLEGESELDALGVGAAGERARGDLDGVVGGAADVNEALVPVYAAMDQVDQIPESQEIPIVAPRA